MVESTGNGPPVILAVEDEPLILELIRHTLEEAGFEVETASSAGAAVALLERKDSLNYRALVTDVDLGNKFSGWDVACHARQVHAEIPVIYVTGGGSEQWSAHGVPNSVLITKPFAPAQLVTAVSQLLNSGASTSA